MSDQIAEFNENARKVIKDVQTTFEGSGGRNGGWVVTRRLSRPEGEPRTELNEGYLDALPTYKGLTFVDWIKQKGQGGKQVSLLDIGGGAGVASLDLREIFTPEQLKITVIGHQQDTELPLYDPDKRLVKSPTAQLLKEAQIDFIHTNFTEAQQLLATNSFDIATAVYSLEWIRYPRLSMIKKVWRLLEPNGIAFISPFSAYLSLPNGQQILLAQYLVDKFGLKFEGNNNGISFEKTQDNIPNVFQYDLKNISTVKLK